MFAVRELNDAFWNACVPVAETESEGRERDEGVENRAARERCLDIFR